MALVKCDECNSMISRSAQTCPQCGAKRPKRTNPVALLAALLFGAAMLSVIWDRNANDRATAVREAARATTEHEARTQECRGTIDQRKADYARLLDEHKFWDARLSLEDCPEILNDASLRQLRDGATRLDLLQRAENTNGKADDRLSAIASLKQNFPADAAQFDAIKPRLQAKADAQQAADLARHATAEKARKRKEGVSLGMSKDDVLASSWGRPQSVNRTTTAAGTHEQWVYGHSYLYFDDGVLTAIQN